MSPVREPPSAPLVWRLGLTRGALAAVLGLTAAVVAGFFRVENLAHQGQQARQALCAVKESTRDQIRTSIQFLVDIGTTGREFRRFFADDLDLLAVALELQRHPRKPIPGISETDILQGIARQQKFLKSLDNLNC